MDFDELVKRTLKVREQFRKRSTNFDKRDRVLDLVEEVGELAHAVLMVEGRKKKNIEGGGKKVSDVADALSDMLFDMIVLAEDYQIDLVKDYERMLKELRKRIKKGEFDGNER